MPRTRIFLILLVLILLLGNVTFILKYASARQQVANAEKVIQVRVHNDKVLSFTNLFIGKVLKARGEVSFEDRLELERQVRDLQEPVALAAWNTFVNSKTEAEAQASVKELLATLVGAIKVQ